MVLGTSDAKVHVIGPAEFKYPNVNFGADFTIQIDFRSLTIVSTGNVMPPFHLPLGPKW